MKRILRFGHMRGLARCSSEPARANNCQTARQAGHLLPHATPEARSMQPEAPLADLREESGSVTETEVASDAIRKTIRSFGLRNGMQPTDADDLAQDVLSVILARARCGEVVRRALVSFALTTALSLFLQKIRRGCRTFLQDESAFDKMNAAAPWHRRGVDPQQQTEGSEFLAHIEDGVGNMPPRERVVAQLCLVGEVEIGEAAIILGIREGAVRAALLRARRRLEKIARLHGCILKGRRHYPSR